MKTKNWYKHHLTVMCLFLTFLFISGSLYSQRTIPASGSGYAAIDAAEWNQKWNLFLWRGKTQAQIDEKVDRAYAKFIGKTWKGYPAGDNTEKYLWSYPGDPSMMYCWWTGDNGWFPGGRVTIEAQSNSLMTAVQMGDKATFDAIWKFTKTFMQIGTRSSNLKGGHSFFGWQIEMNTDGTADRAKLNDGPAPDGEQWIAAAHCLAAKLWGNSGAVNYQREADDILECMLHIDEINLQNTEGWANYWIPMINKDDPAGTFTAMSNQVGYPGPWTGGNTVTDPGYQIPAFYQLFSEVGPVADRAQWRKAATKSRAYLFPRHMGFDTQWGPAPNNSGDNDNRTSHLPAGRCNYDGSMNASYFDNNYSNYSWEAWRVGMYIGMDYMWWGNSSSSDFAFYPQMSAGIQNTLANVTPGWDAANNKFTYGDSYHLSGQSMSGSTHPFGMSGCNGVLSMSSNSSFADKYVDEIWNVVPNYNDDYSYYLYMNSLIMCAGKFRVSLSASTPPPPPTTVNVTGVSLSSSSLSVGINGTSQLTATVAPSNATNLNVSWSTSNASIATVSSTGLVTGIADGNATITVTTADQNKTATCGVTVTKASSGGGLDLGSFEDGVIAPWINEYAWGTPANDAIVSNNPNKTGINTSNKVAEFHDYGWKPFSRTDNPAKITSSITSIELDVYSNAANSVKLTLSSGSGSDYNSAVVNFSANTWTHLSFDITTAASHDYQKITFISSGNLIYYDNITLKGGSSSTVPVTSVSIAPTSISVGVAATSQLSATVAPSNASNSSVTWSSSNTAVATVNSSGLVTGVAAGSANVTVISVADNSKHDVCAVTVTSSSSTTNINLKDFEDNILAPWTNEYQWGVFANEAVVINNPSKTGINTSNKVAEFHDYGWKPFSRVDNPALVSNSFASVDLDLYSTADNSVKLTLSSGSGSDYNSASVNIPANVWTHVSFEIRTMPCYDYKKISFTSTGNLIYYDNILLKGIVKSASENGETVANVQTLSDKIQVYPNPVNAGEVVNVLINTDENVMITLYDITGKVVLRQTGYSNNGTVEIEGTSGLKGIYLLNVVSGKINQTKRILIN